MRSVCACGCGSGGDYSVYQAELVRAHRTIGQSHSLESARACSYSPAGGPVALTFDTYRVRERYVAPCVRAFGR